jgi:VWFA-related protein
VAGIEPKRVHSSLNLSQVRGRHTAGSPSALPWQVYLPGHANSGPKAMLPLHRLFLGFVLCFLSSIWTVKTNAQSPPVHSSAREEGLINLDVLVTDSSGKPVPGLHSNDFALLENGRPNRIVSFHAFDGVSAQPESPVEVILVVDMLQLPISLIMIELSSVEAFLRKDDGHLAEPVRILTLQESGIWQVADASRDGKALAAQVAHTTQFRLIHRFGSGGGGIRGSPGPTGPPSINALAGLGEIAAMERPKPGRKLLLWVGPGRGGEAVGPNMNTFYTICWFSTLLRESRIALYSISVGETEPSLLYVSYLQGVESVKKASFMNLNRKVLAVQSGGRVLDQSYDLVSEMESCVREASVFYTLSFDPAPADHPEEYHELKVQIDKQGLTAHTNTGYYDQSFYSDQADPAIRQVTVAELKQILEAAHGDGESAKQLSTLELTERLDDATLLSFAKYGKKTEQALTMLADASAFLPLPVAQISTDAPPDVNTQQHLISLAANYLQQIIPKLPNFFAERTTARYQETSVFDAVNRRVEHEPMLPVESFKETILYRNGQEVADARGAKRKKRNAKDPDLITYGTFGPVLGFVHDAIATPGVLTWSHWEQSPSGLRAVFRYRVPAEKSLYTQRGCCLPDGEGTTAFERWAGYHGEISIDPSSGAILRLQAEAEIAHFPPVSKSDIMISYGPVEIGGKSYICPQKSVSIVRMRSIAILGEWDEGFRTYGPWATLVNDITYRGYHMFRGESRMMPGFNQDVEK